MKKSERLGLHVRPERDLGFEANTKAFEINLRPILFLIIQVFSRSLLFISKIVLTDKLSALGSSFILVSVS